MLSVIKSKKFNIVKRSLLLLYFVVIFSFTMVACDNKESVITTEEFELVSCYVESRNETNLYGGVLKTKEYFHYAYVNDEEKVVFDEIYLPWAEFEITDKTSKVIITSNNGSTNYTFKLTKEMYNKLNSAKE